MCNDCMCGRTPETRTPEQVEQDNDTEYRWTAAILVGVVITTAIVMMLLDKAGYI